MGGEVFGIIRLSVIMLPLTGSGFPSPGAGNLTHSGFLPLICRELASWLDADDPEAAGGKRSLDLCKCSRIDY